MESRGIQPAFGENIKFVARRLNEDGTPVDITGATGRIQIRRRFGQDLLLEVSSALGQITVPVGTDGRIHVDIPPSDYVDVLSHSTKYVFDLEVTYAPDDIEFYVQYQLILLPTSTEPAP